jgi:hypothetical protein
MQRSWSPYEPSPGEWTLKQAGHLLRRVTFGFTAGQLHQALVDGPQRTIDRLLARPPEYAAFEDNLRSLTPREAKPIETEQLALYRIMNSPWPLHEKASLFGSSPEELAQWLTGMAGTSFPLPQNETLSTVLRSQVFFSLADYRQKAKSPLEFALNLSIALGSPLAPATLHSQLVKLGQPPVDLAARRRWLNPFTIIARAQVAAGIIDAAKHPPEGAAMIEALVQNDLPPDTVTMLKKLDGREVAVAIAARPEFQML